MSVAPSTSASIMSVAPSTSASIMSVAPSTSASSVRTVADDPTQGEPTTVRAVRAPVSIAAIKNFSLAAGFLALATAVAQFASVKFALAVPATVKAIFFTSAFAIGSVSVSYFALAAFAVCLVAAAGASARVKKVKPFFTVRLAVKG